MKLSTRSLAAIALLIAIEGAVILGSLALHGGVSWADAAGILGVAAVSALVIGVVLRRESR